MAFAVNFGSERCCSFPVGAAMKLLPKSSRDRKRPRNLLAGEAISWHSFCSLQCCRCVYSLFLFAVGMHSPV